ncbi:hypothetical protein WJX72_001992 [[Myrmecia] bisecta]|uniref:DUF5722 domain-containing protein n=1 Tax=[Myrmecia] bisecta TaxID=41462 RepID=A0AAW1QP80_9CHLO
MLDSFQMANQGAVRKILKGVSISDGYALPLDKQGVHDQRYMLTFNINQGRFKERNQRYDALMDAIQPGVRRYNVFWYAIEKSGVAPSDTPITCPREFILVPASQAEKAAKGYNRFHCYHYAEIADMASYLALDASRGIESVATIWGTPTQFRDPNCVGFKINGAWTYNSCVPRDDAMRDYADFVNFLAERWNDDIRGRFKHFIIWNEVANADWFDTSPQYNVTKLPTPAEVNYWIDKYVAMLRVSHDAIQRHFKGASPALMYVSLDRIYKTPGKCPPTGFQHCHIGGRQMLQGIWDRINTTIDWSVAVHPYGDPNKSDWDQHGMYTFADLHYVIQDQLDNLRKYGVADPTTAPQAMLAASEQGWHGEGALATGLANNLCVAHRVVTNYTELIWVTHNDFQGVRPNDYPGFVPMEAQLNLTGTPDSVVLNAYKATNRNTWALDPDNWCCQQLKIGCPANTTGGVTQV